MAHRTIGRARPRQMALGWLAVGLGVALLVGGCLEQKRAEGQDCLKDEDCLSGVCVQLQCGSAPPLTHEQPDALAPGAGDASYEDAPMHDGQAEGSADGAPEGSADAAGDGASAAPDGAIDGAIDAAPDAAASPDAADSSTDAGAASDAHV